MEKWPIGVFTSIGAGLGAGLEAVKEIGVPTVQLHAPPAEYLNEEKANEVKAQLAEAAITATVVFSGFAGESYADIPTVHKTVGLVPAGPRAERIAITKKISDFTKVLGVEAVGMHIGAVPSDPTDPVYKDVVAAAQEVCDHCKANGQRFHLETGQEPAATLLRFIADVGRDNLAINFDPANMILYGAGEPVAALKATGKFVKSCHCKDGTWSANPGKDWGEETPLGKGDVGIENFIKALKEIGYEGALTIEREISGDQQKKDIVEAVKLLEKLRAEILLA